MNKTGNLTTLLLFIFLILCITSAKSQVNPPGKRVQNIYFHGTWVGDYDDFNEAVFKFKQNGTKVELDRGHDDGWKWYGQITNGVLKFYETKIIKNSGTWTWDYRFKLLGDGHSMECTYAELTGKNFRTMILKSTYRTKKISEDSDQDQVLNEFDKCPNTPKGLKVHNGGVDLMGCPTGQNSNQQTNTKYRDRYDKGIKELIPFRIDWLEDKNREKKVPRDCGKAKKLKELLYSKVPTVGLDECLDEAERNYQKKANLKWLNEDCEFKWGLNMFYKKCEKEIDKLKANDITSSNSNQSSGYQVQPNEKESSAIKKLSDILVENVYSSDILTDDQKMRNKGYTIFKQGTSHYPRVNMPKLVVKSGKVYYNENTNKIIVPDNPNVKAVLKYRDGSVLTLKSGAKLELINSDQIYISRNGVHVRVVKSGNEFLVRTQTAVCGIRGTEFDIGYFNGTTKVKLYEGSIAIFNEQHSIMLLPNEQAEIPSKTSPIKRSKNKKNVKLISTSGKIPYTLPQAKWLKQNTIDGYYSTAISSSGTEEMVYVTGSISSSQYTPNVHRIHYHQKSRSAHNMGSDANGIFSLDEKHLWVCGKRGGIAFNENSALEAFWKTQNSGTTLDLNDIYFINENNGWCVGNNGTVLYSKNGGNTWNVKTGFIRKHLVGVQFVGNNNGWILCNGTYYPSEMPLIYHTKDGGNTWQATEVAAGITNSRMDINAMWFIDKNNGWIVGANNLIMFTKDGGVSWDYYQKAKQGGTDLKDIQFTDPWNGWICGEKGLLLHTIDGGKTWKKETINGETATFANLHFNGPYLGWLVTTKQIYQFKDENLFNQYRQKFIKGEWDKWSEVSKTDNNEINTPERQNEQITSNKPVEPKKKINPTNKKKTITNPPNKKQTITKPNNNNSFAELWSLNTYNNNIESFKQSVTTKTNKGFVPVGLNCANSQYEVLYLGGGVLTITAWNMEWYNDANTLQQGINKNMNQGYIPSGFSWNGEAYYVFYIKTNFTGKAWQIVPSSLDLKAVSKAITPFVDQNYVPMGITIFGNEYYTLLVQFETPLANKWFIEGYKDNRSEIVKNINKNLPNGTVPWGILKSSGVANILYIGM